MKKKAIKCLSMLTVLGVIGCTEMSAYGATLNSFYGTVYVRKGGGQSKTNAINGMSLASGDIICTGKWSGASVKIDSGKNVTLGGSTTVYVKNISTISQGKGSTVSTGSGGRINHQTPNSIMGVKGTTYTTNIEKDKTKAKLLEGNVNTAYGGQLIMQLKPGQQAIVNGNGGNIVSSDIDFEDLSNFELTELMKIKEKFDIEIQRKLEEIYKNRYRSGALNLNDDIEEESIVNNVDYKSQKKSKSHKRSRSSSSRNNTTDSVVIVEEEQGEESEYYDIVSDSESPAIHLYSTSKRGKNITGYKINMCLDNTSGMDVNSISIITLSENTVNFNRTDDLVSFIMPDEDVIIRCMVNNPDKVEIVY